MRAPPPATNHISRAIDSAARFELPFYSAPLAVRFYADSVEPFGPDVGVIDITTRQNIQLRTLRRRPEADLSLPSLTRLLTDVDGPAESSLLAMLLCSCDAAC